MKKWLVLAGLAIGMICAMLCIKLYPTNAAQDATATNGVFTLEQLTDNSYTGVYESQYGAIFNTDKDTKYSVVTTNGDVYVLDNSDGKYGTLSIGTGSSVFNIVYSRNSQNKKSILNFDGTYYGGLKGYYSNVNLSLNSYKGKDSGDYYYTDDAGTTHFCTKDGTQIAAFVVDSLVNNIVKLGNYYMIEKSGSGDYLYDSKGTLISSYKHTDGRFESITELGFEWYQYVDDSYTGTDAVTSYGRKYIIKCYNSNLDEITESEFNQLTANYSVADGNAVFFKYLSEDQQYALPDNYTAKYTGTISGTDVVVGSKVIDSGVTHALFYKNGTMILGNIYSYDCVYKNIVIVKDGASYKAVKLSIPGSQQPTQEATTGATTGATQEGTTTTTNTTGATTSDVSEITSDGNGNLSASVVAANSDNDLFSMVASENVIPAGSKFSVAKVVSGTAYDATKQVIQNIADKFVVYNIDLLNSANVKTEPDGTIQITMPVPAGYNTGRISVYRMSDDNSTYVELPANIVDGNIVFTTDHFSTYVIAQDKQSADTNSTTPATGDMSNIPGLLAIASFAALAGVACVGKKYIIK